MFQINLQMSLYWVSLSKEFQLEEPDKQARTWASSSPSFSLSTVCWNFSCFWKNLIVDSSMLEISLKSDEVCRPSCGQMQRVSWFGNINSYYILNICHRRVTEIPVHDKLLWFMATARHWERESTTSSESPSLCTLTKLFVMMLVHVTRL